MNGEKVIDAFKLAKIREGFAELARAAAVAESAFARAAAVVGSTDLPIAGREVEWDGPAAMRRVFDFYTDEAGDVDTDAVARAFLWRDEDADPATQRAYRLGYADIIDGTLTMVPRGVSSSAGGHGVNAANIPEEDKQRIRSRICGLYDRIREQVEDWPACPFDEDAEDMTAVEDTDDGGQDGV